jgi:hypothetical protein
MAFTRAPSQSTYQVKPVELIFSSQVRNQQGNRDALCTNGFFDILMNKGSGTQEYMFVKRDGTTKYPYTCPSINIRGMFYWEDKDRLYVAYNDKIDVVVASTGALSTTVTPFTTTSGEVGFTEFYYDTGASKVVVSDGTRLITIDDANVVVTGSDADMPTPHSPHTLFLDGYLFIVKAGTSDIYNSNLNDPLAYTSGDFITAEMLPDKLIRIARLNNYIVAFGSASIEYFFNAANASGSPLSRNDTPIKQDIGYLGGYAVHHNKIYFVGSGSTTTPDVYVLEDFKMEQLKAPPLRRYLEPYSSFAGSVISFAGHDFYVVSTGSITYILDLETAIWTRLAFKETSTMPIEYAAVIRLASGANACLFTQTGLADLHYFNPAVFRDDVDNFTVTLITPQQEFDVYREKYMSRVSVNSDRAASSANLFISWTDDDYLTYTTPRPVNLSLEYPNLTRCGRFRKRAFRLTFTENVPMRLRNLEVDYNIGAR